MEHRSSPGRRHVKYTAINGWTVARMKAAIRAGNNGQPAVEGRGGQCMYLTARGNRCAVGCFVPDGHPGQKMSGWVRTLLGAYPDLRGLMPLPDDAMHTLQETHDYHYKGSGDVRDALDAWIDANVVDAEGTP